MNLPSISVCAIFKDEEKFLPEFLDSFDSLADEWILTDTGSTDESLRIIKNKGIECHYFEWSEHFSKARNFGIVKAKSDWIFIADIDDRVRPEHIRVLRGVLQKTTAVAVTINYINLKKPDWTSDKPIELNRQIRMVCFRNGLNIHYRGAVHEDPMPSIEEIGGKVFHLDIPIYHLGYADELFKLKSIRNSKLITKEWEDGKRDPDLVHYYTSMHWGPEKWIREALENAQNQICTVRSIRVIEDLYYWYMDFDPNYCAEIKKNLKAQKPDSATFLLESARKNFIDHKSDLAVRLFNDLWLKPPLSYPIRYRSEVALRLAFLFASRGDVLEASKFIDSYRENYPWTASLWHLKLKLLATLGYWNEIQELLVHEIPNAIMVLEERKKKEILKILRHSPIDLKIPMKFEELVEYECDFTEEDNGSL